jgi:hypothetical protein
VVYGEGVGVLNPELLYIGIVTGNPGVFQGYPYPNPSKPVPLGWGTGNGFASHGS